MLNKILKTVLSLVAAVLVSVNSYAQERVQTPPSDNISLAIPDYYKSNEPVTSKNISYVSKYSGEVKGFITVAFDKQLKLVEVTAPRHLGIERLNVKEGGMADCVKNCGGTWACAAACLYDKIEDVLTLSPI